MIRREHHAARREHDVEARILVGHVLGVSDVELHGDALLGRSLPRGIDENRGEVHADDVGAALRREDRHGPGSGGSVEDAFAGLRIRAFDHELVDVANRVRDALVGAIAPHDALPRLQLCECHFPP